VIMPRVVLKQCDVVLIDASKIERGVRSCWDSKGGQSGQVL
jgi:hypothetical protein